MVAKEVELKRVIMVKAVVTDAFKGNLIKELERAVKNIDTQAQQMEFQAKSYLDGLKKKGLVQRVNSFKRQLEDERGRQAAAKNDLLRRVEEAKKLALNSEFAQGPLEGPVTVKAGDNLYKKIGGGEIIVKDGVIKEIRGIE